MHHFKIVETFLLTSKAKRVMFILMEKIDFPQNNSNSTRNVSRFVVNRNEDVLQLCVVVVIQVSLKIFPRSILKHLVHVL